ncbi:MAG: hypothetical protein KDA89_05580 [Planctomycetaceae bacterium]|nr:hypothetical protein [Planctomycetaceae bacterium]
MAKSKSSPDPVVELSKAIREELSRRAAGEGEYPCTLRSAAVDVCPEVSGDEILASASKNPLKKDVLSAFPNDPDSLIVLKQDKEVLAGDHRLLKELLWNVCSPQMPHVSSDILKESLPKTLQATFAKVWKSRLTNGELPDFVESLSVSSGKGKPKQEFHDVRFPLPWVELSQQLVNSLRSLQAGSGQAFTLAEIVSAAGDVNSSMVEQALTADPFAVEVRVVRKGGNKESFSLTDLASQVVVSDGFLQSMIQEECSTESPEVKLSQLKKQLPKEFAAEFAAHWLRTVERREVRPFFEVVKSTKKDVSFRDTRFPRREVVLSAKLVAALEEMRTQDDLTYPCTFPQLCRHVGSEAGILIASAAAQLEPYASRVAAAVPKSADSPIAFVEDAKVLAASPGLVPALLSSQIKSDVQAVPIDRLSKAKGVHGAVQPHILTALEAMLTRDELPPQIGALKISKKWHLFFLKDVKNSSGISPATVERSVVPESAKSVLLTPSGNTTTASSFAQDFIKAFEHLDRASGHRNYLKLLDLRRELGQYDRPQFDAGILDLCRTRQFWLESSEGSMVRLSEDEKAAGIMDGGNLLIYCRRRS